MPPRSLFPLDAFDPNDVVADIEAIRECNPQRYEFEQLTRICHFDKPSGQVGGVLEIPEDPFWARGHIPGRPLMPGVLMIESLAQLCSWAVTQVYDPEEVAGRFFGFGGVDGVKFRGTIHPGQTMILIGLEHEIRPRRAIYDTQGWVDGQLAIQARITGMWV